MSAPASIDNPFGSETSGTTSWRLSAYTMIGEAYAYCGIGLDTEGEALTDGYLSEGMNTLNTTIATLQAQGLHLWTYQEGYLFLEAGVSSYVLEQVRATNRYLQTTTVTAIITAGNTVELTSVSELDLGWSIGVMNSDQNLIWNTVDAIAGSLVTIDGTWPEDIDISADVFYYETSVRPVERILDVRRSNTVQQNNDTPVQLDSHQKFFRLSDKTSQGSVSSATYDRVLPEGVMYVWQTPLNSSEQIRFTYERKIEDFIANDDCPDFPKYYTELLIFRTAKRLAAKYNVSMARKQEIKELLLECETDIENFDNANYDIEVTINGGAR